MILVIGGTGRLGRQVVQRLVAASEPVRVLTRSAERGRAAHGSGAGGSEDQRGNQTTGVEYLRGDLLDRESVVAALKGVDSVVVTAHGGEGTGRTGPRGVEGRGLPQLIQIASGSSLRQFVYL